MCREGGDTYKRFLVTRTIGVVVLITNGDRIDVLWNGEDSPVCSYIPGALTVVE